MKIPERIQRNIHLKEYTTFKIGGPAELLTEPETAGEMREDLRWAHSQGLKPFILGEGANILVSDKGIPGLVICTRKMTGCTIVQSKQAAEVEILAGTKVDDAIEFCAQHSLEGLEFLYGMPGSIGGALWMNARCCGSEVSSVLMRADCARLDGSDYSYIFNPDDWDYKISPFQDNDTAILSARFSLSTGDTKAIRQKMRRWKDERKEKGHYRFPSAGSMFKNDYAVGKPSGQIIEELGLRGMRKGDAQVAPFHGNFFINTGNASAADMRSLVFEVQHIVREKTGITLEPEVRFVGDWS